MVSLMFMMGCSLMNDTPDDTIYVFTDDVEFLGRWICRENVDIKFIEPFESSFFVDYSFNELFNGEILLNGVLYASIISIDNEYMVLSIDNTIYYYEKNLFKLMTVIKDF
jgi:hypothetical protein